MRVLVSAYACEPGKGSEPAVGWNWVRQLSESNELWVLTRANNRQSIEGTGLTNSACTIRFVYFDLPAWARFWKRKGQGLRLYYCLWQLQAYFIAKRLHRRVSFDLIHHVTFVNYWLPTLLAMLPVPFIWGPVGGGESAPRAFRRFFGLKGNINEFLRDLVRGIAHLNPVVRITARRAVCAFATTIETEKKLRSLGCSNISLLSQVALPHDEIEALRRSSAPKHGGEFRVVSLGRFLHWKGFNLGLQAFAELQRRVPASEYWLIGDGPERKHLERLAQTLGIQEQVRFFGMLPRTNVLKKLAECDVLLHPSFHDSGGYVCLEAMAAGLPVICLDLGGPAVQVVAETGIKVPAKIPERVVADLAAALTGLADDSTIRTRLGEAGRRRAVEEFSWKEKADRVNQVYAFASKGFRARHARNCSATH